MALRLAVVGTGHLGKIHARLARSLPEAELVAVVDPVAAARESVAGELGVAALADHRELIGRVDAAIVAAPTRLHHSVGMDLLAAGVHVLMEKPIASSLAEANELVAAARANRCVLQVGHIERFSPALGSVVQHIAEPKFIEAVRSSTYTFRSTDIGVVFDLMIHDLDIILSLVRSPVVAVEALGAAVFGPEEDIARATLHFENGCIAQLSASRVSYVAQRAMQVYMPSGFASLDFATRSARIVRPHPAIMAGMCDVNALTHEEKCELKERVFTDLLLVSDHPAVECNPLVEEQRDFVQAIATGRAPRVTGEQGRDNLAVAERILTSIAAHQWDGTAAGRIGAHLTPAPVPAMSPVPAPHFLHRPAAQPAPADRRVA